MGLGVLDLLHLSGSCGTTFPAIKYSAGTEDCVVVEDED